MKASILEELITRLEVHLLILLKIPKAGKLEDFVLWQKSFGLRVEQLLQRLAVADLVGQHFGGLKKKKNVAKKKKAVKHQSGSFCLHKSV